MGFRKPCKACLHVQHVSGRVGVEDGDAVEVGDDTIGPFVNYSGDLGELRPSCADLWCHIHALKRRVGDKLNRDVSSCLIVSLSDGTKNETDTSKHVTAPGLVEDVVDARGGGLAIGANSGRILEVDRNADATSPATVDIPTTVLAHDNVVRLRIPVCLFGDQGNHTV